MLAEIGETIHRYGLSLKDMLNFPSGVKTPNYTQLFLSDENIESVISNLKLQVRANKGIYTTFDRKQIKRLAEKWAANGQLEQYDVYDGIKGTGKKGWPEFLNVANSKFVRDHAFLYKTKFGTESNPTREVVNGKKFKDFLADDIKNYDVWSPDTVIVNKSMYRNENRYPINNINPSRHYDRGNEGLRSYNPETASRLAPIYGYDMSEIYRRQDQEYDGEFRF